MFQLIFICFACDIILLSRAICVKCQLFLFAIYQDIQTDSPFHLLRLKVEVEKGKLMVLLQDCQAELTRENRHLPSTGSERLIKEHRVTID